MADSSSTSLPQAPRAHRLNGGKGRRVVMARYDAAQSTETNRNLWNGVDALSADAAMSVPVRRILRNRCRHEVANNPYAMGAKLTICNDTVGTGPSVHMNTGDDELDSFIEKEWDSWCRAVRYAEKLRILRGSRFESGEAFLVFFFNPNLPHRIKLDVAVVESEQISDPESISNISDPLWNDGIRFDTYGNPASYRVLKHHPGGTSGWQQPWAYDDVDARFVFHYIRRDRPGQRRGIPEITPALTAFAEVRRFTGAVLDAAELAARFAVVFESDTAPGEEETPDGPDAMDTAELPRTGGVFMPKGYKANQMEAEQPVTTYGDFLYKKLGEIGRCINFPVRMMTLDASLANMSASYVDAQPYARDREIDRDDLNVGNDQGFDLFLMMGELQADYFPSKATNYAHDWVWPSLGHHADPDKVASAQAQNLKNGSTSLARIYSHLGLDWEKEMPIAAKTLNLTMEEYQSRLATQILGAPAPVVQNNVAVNTEEGAEESSPVGAALPPDQLKVYADATGALVRAGVLTPSEEDEDHIRKIAGLPEASADVQEAWKKTGTREPITIRDESVPAEVPAAATPAEEGETPESPEQPAEAAGVLDRLSAWLKRKRK